MRHSRPVRILPGDGYSNAEAAVIPYILRLDEQMNLWR
jgi:hypothetical protein